MHKSAAKNPELLVKGFAGMPYSSAPRRVGVSAPVDAVRRTPYVSIGHLAVPVAAPGNPNFTAVARGAVERARTPGRGSGDLLPVKAVKGRPNVIQSRASIGNVGALAAQYPELAMVYY